MAWSVFNSLNMGAGNKTASMSLSSTGNSIGAAIGEVVFIQVVKDNASTTNGETNEVTSVTDSVGNTYTKIKEWCNSRGSANAGTVVALFYTVVTATIATTTTHTANFSASTAAKTMIGFAFRVNAGSTVSVQDTPATTTANNSTNPGSLDVTTPNAEFLRLRVIGAETSDFNPNTITSGWGTLAEGETSGGASHTNQGNRGEIIIYTGTNNASAPALNSNADSASIYVAMKENLASATNPGGWLGKGGWF